MKYELRDIMWRIAAILGLTLAACAGKAEVYILPGDGGSVIGEIVSTIATEEDTLLDIARQHSLG